MKPVLEIQNISKQFRIGSEKQDYLSLRDSIVNIFKPKNKSHLFQALQDVSFDVMPGETVGIIGKNGAGKSTLLKILSKITPPSSGKIISRGRIASLLEVGTGFHTELTGRENVFLNGSILGMKKAEIQKNFDAIVNFAGVERFLDTPLKHYSSGMQLRLAFAVAAFLENEILVIDEVLAVGDVEFQKKCMGKMEDVSKSGRTILFVSHNMASMKSLCKSGIMLQSGKVAFKGSMINTIETYLTLATKTETSGNIPGNASTYNTGIVKFTKFMLIDETGNSIDTVNYLAPISLYFELNNQDDLSGSLLDVRINTLDGIELAHAMNTYSSSGSRVLKKGKNRLHCKITNHLQPGKYSFTIGIHKPDGTTLDYVENILDFNVSNIGMGESGDFAYNFKLGLVRFESTWKIEN
jgi:lipopolysaccharide transport system ATP-binding protein